MSLLITFYNIHWVYMKKHRPGNVKRDMKSTPQTQMTSIQRDIQVYKRCTGGDIKMTSVHMSPREPAATHQVYFNNDPSAGSPTETLLRLLLPLNDQV